MNRCCSFCRNPGHTINLCQDSRIEETWKYILRETDLRLGNSMEEEDLTDVDTLLRQLPLHFLRVIGVQYGGITLRSSTELHISSIKTAIREEAEHFIYLRWNERIDYLNWLDPDSYDFEEREESEDEDANIDLNTAFIAEEEEDPNDIRHFAFIDRTPMDIEEGNKEVIEPMMFCLETATELSALMECIVCLDEKSAIHFDTTNCGHSFCHSCICHHLDTSKNGPTCPSCRTMIHTLAVKDIENYDDIVKRYGKSQPKIQDHLEDAEFDWFAPSGLSFFL